MKRTLALAVASFCWLFSAFGAQDQVPVKRGAEVLRPVRQDVSKPLREIPPAPAVAGVKREIPNRDIYRDPENPNEPVAGRLDTVLQMAPGTLNAPANSATFDGSR